MICGTKLDLRKRRLVQAAQGTQYWVPWSERQHAAEAIAEAKALDTWIVVAEQLRPVFAPSSSCQCFPHAWCWVASVTGFRPRQ